MRWLIYILPICLLLSCKKQVVTTNVKKVEALSKKSPLNKERLKENVLTCETCHGVEGLGEAGQEGFPKIANLRFEYIEKQLLDFKNKLRVDTEGVMSSMVEALSVDDIKDLALYFSNLPNKEIKRIDKKYDENVLLQGKWIAEMGLWEKGVPACFKCHGANAHGVAPFFPRLAGQHSDYIAKQLNSWKSGIRRNDINSMMKPIAVKLNESEIHAVSIYLESIRM